MRCLEKKLLHFGIQPYPYEHKLYFLPLKIRKLNWFGSFADGWVPVVAIFSTNPEQQTNKHSDQETENKTYNAVVDDVPHLLRHSTSFRAMTAAAAAEKAVTGLPPHLARIYDCWRDRLHRGHFASATTHNFLFAVDGGAPCAAFAAARPPWRRSSVGS